jgi:hypothetical protein
MKRFLIVLALLVFFVLNPVSASVSFSSLGQLAPQQILVYGYNATSGHQELFATGNTSGDAIAVPDGDYTIVIKPDNVAVASTPEGMLDAILTFALAHYVNILFVCFFIGIALYYGRK